jgi:hypothetical protein
VHIRGAYPELPLGALRAEHRQVVVDVEVRPPLIVGVLVRARHPTALGADEPAVVRGYFDQS